MKLNKIFIYSYNKYFHAEKNKTSKLFDKCAWHDEENTFYFGGIG